MVLLPIVCLLARGTIRTGESLLSSHKSRVRIRPRARHSTIPTPVYADWCRNTDTGVATFFEIN
jgi:hypothetical protein